MVMDLSAEDKASGIKFCTAVHQHIRQGITNFCETALPEAQKRTNRPLCTLNYKQNWEESSLACRPRLTCQISLKSKKLLWTDGRMDEEST